MGSFFFYVVLGRAGAEELLALWGECWRGSSLFGMGIDKGLVCLGVA